MCVFAIAKVPSDTLAAERLLTRISEQYWLNFFECIDTKAIGDNSALRTTCANLRSLRQTRHAGHPR
jgi:hypothetical protein